MKKLGLTIFAAVASVVLAAPALADTATYTLDATSVTIASGGTYEFSGTINVTGTGTYYLGDTFSGDAPITLDDSDFLNDTPISVTGNYSYSGPLFSVTAPGGTLAGAYVENFGVLFYTDPAGGTPAFSQDLSFTVNVANAAAVTPEPGSWLLLTTGLAGAGMLRRRFAVAR